MAQRICSIPDCGRPHYGHGWCSSHHARWVRHGDPLHGGPIGWPEWCSVPDCGKPAKAKGFCIAHYQRWRKHGDPLPDEPVLRSSTPSDGKCSIPECESPHMSYGFCKKHYDRWRKHGDPLVGGLPEVPSYAAAHARLRKQRGVASSHACVDCGEQACDWSYMGGAPDEMVDPRTGFTYSSDPDFYQPRCRPDHARFDGVVAKSWVVRRRK